MEDDSEKIETPLHKSCQFLPLSRGGQLKILNLMVFSLRALSEAAGEILKMGKEVEREARFETAQRLLKKIVMIW